MTKMADYKLKNSLKIFFSRTRMPMILKLGVKHQGLEPYKIDINHDLGMIDLFYGKVNLGCLCICIGKSEKMSFYDGKLAGNEQLTDLWL